MPTVSQRPRLVIKPQPQKTEQKKSFPLAALWLPLTMLYCETVAHLFFFGFSPDSGTFFRSAMALLIGFVLSAVSLAFKEKGFRVFTATALFLTAFYFSFHLVYNSSMHSFFSWQVIGLAGDVAQYWRETLVFILRCAHKILLCALPFILFLVCCKRRDLVKTGSVKKGITANACAAAVLTLAVTVVLCVVPTEYDILRYIRNDISKAYKTYGVVTASTADLAQCVFGVPEEIIVSPDLIPEKDGVEYNKLDIDFDSLIANEDDEDIREMHEYFKNAPATEKNEYTGMFEGKNLIFLSLEAFSHHTIDPVYTPTLYKMYNEGFRFNNFYSTLWGGSTATGEYSNLTGNFYHTADCIEQSADTLQHFALGNLFGREGYGTYAYHNHVGTYYRRNLAHPNLGFDVFKAEDFGLVLETVTWPSSDLEMAQATTGDYMGGEQPFLAYYMTVSGHANFSWTANDMSERHRYDIDPNLDYNESTKAYLACQLEVEQMLNELIYQLKACGQLENTVFAMCCDHYPYALSDDSLSELYGLPEKNIRDNYELYKNAFILWSPTMEKPIEVDTPCSSYDILPTLANLFGIEYDSRLITGKDILSETEKIVVINTLGSGGSWNWITTQGSYSTATGKFTPSTTCTMTKTEIKEYVAQTKLRVACMRKYSFGILDRDYYSYIFDAD